MLFPPKQRQATGAMLGARLGAQLGSAAGLLLATGGLLGLMPLFGKLAIGSGASPLAWAFVISFGAGLVLGCVQLARGKPPVPTARKLRYFVVTAAITFAIPNILIFSAVSHLGAGYTGIMYTLSPVITLVLSMLLRVRPPNLLGVGGIAVGFLGAVMVAATRGEVGQPAALFWVAIGLLIPLSLAAGNIYRSLDWPEDAGPIELAVGSHLAAALMLLAGMLATGDLGSLARLTDLPLLVVAQVAASSAMFALLFRLQVVGGPVYLSQIGYVGAAVGLVAGVVILGERYALPTWAGAAIIAAGVVMTTKAQK
jgi:drug/metabolite transporter (DMT)-like permease